MCGQLNQNTSHACWVNRRGWLVAIEKVAGLGTRLGTMLLYGENPAGRVVLCVCVYDTTRDMHTQCKPRARAFSRCGLVARV